ncbi:hypothetical protein PHMEG_00018757 [Phytophthora megakarya]|uniref:Bzip transcription factor n=1 Tax=Phytophthora megakarya TaxID=4795 RepID=A0A225VVV1_9STRA|nr:hypothetical protein PHMEG_00018757 [Phytophthora megakarya]
MASVQETSHLITDELKHAIVAEALKKKIRHRERCRISQARYRNKQHKFETDIQATVSKLKREIEVLEAKCKDSSRLPETPTMWTIAAEYIRHLSYYVASPAMLQPTVSKYLHGIMAPDVIVGSKFGVEAQLENWKLFALYFDDIQLELRGMNILTSDMLVAHTMINVTITSNTLRRVFPHLNSDGCGGTKGGSWSPLATKMLDQKLVMRGSVVFGWDNATDKVARVQFQADLMTPMIKLLRNLRNVNKQQKIKTDIQDDISKLQYEIEQLEAKRKGSSRLPTSPTFWSIAAEYMRHFSYYVSSPGWLQSTTSKFLHDIMAPDVMVGSASGVEAQLENWTLFALYFDDVQLELRGMNMLTSDTLVAFTIITITITSNTLRRAFPHLNSDGCGGTNGGSWAPLAIQMLDQKLVMRGSVVFGWDNVMDKVVRVEFQADMMTPMTKLLGNLSKVSCVFEQARVTPDCRMLN